MQLKHTLPTLLLVTTLATLAPAAEKPAVGDKAPDISWIRLSDNETENVSDFAGKVVVLDFWASWCPPCQKPMAKMQTYADTYPEFVGKTAFIAVSVDRDRKKLEDHLSKKGWDKSHNVWDDDNENDAYGVTGIPSVFIIGKDGTVAASGHPARLDIPALVKAELAK